MTTSHGLPTRPPALDQLLEREAFKAMVAAHGRTGVMRVARAGLAAWRHSANTPGANERAVDPVTFDIRAFESACSKQLAADASMHLRPVVNMTGTVLHTNLGRAVAPPEAIAAVAAVMGGASNLEYDLSRGKRGDRDDHVEGLLRELTGAEAATVVNNNAAAVLLTLSALASSKEVPVSRGELVEIGGSFRIPDIMRRAGAKLVEVGTTNRTHASDFEQALTPKTALVMKVHTSNYAIQGFTSSVSAAELTALAHAHGLPCVEDLGCGSLVDLTRWGLPAEPTPQSSIASGVDVVTFSGDKLLGGPQAGLIVGGKDLIARIKRHPLKRALRLDKMTIAALEATLKLYRDPDTLADRLPTLRWLSRPSSSIQRLSDALAQKLQSLSERNGWPVEWQSRAMRSQIGSGSLPIDRLDSWGVCLTTQASASPKRRSGFPMRVAQALAQGPLPVIGRIEDGQLCLDARCLEVEQLDAVVGAVQAMLVHRRVDP